MKHLVQNLVGSLLKVHWAVITALATHNILTEHFSLEDLFQMLHLMLLTNLNQKMSGFRGDMLCNNTVEALAFAGC